MAGIHTGGPDYAKEMIKIGFQFISISSDFRFMSTYAKNVLDEVKNRSDSKSQNSTY